MFKMINLAMTTLMLVMMGCRQARLETNRQNPRVAPPVTSSANFTAPPPTPLTRSSQVTSAAQTTNSATPVAPVKPVVDAPAAPVDEAPVHVAASEDAPRPLTIHVNKKPAPAQTGIADELCAENQPCKPVLPIKAQCDIPTGAQVVAQNAKQLDIVFFVDTSRSIVVGPAGSRDGGYLRSIAEQMDSFINQLDPETNYHIAVILAHGPRSPYFGKLFSLGGNDPLVLMSEKMTKQQMWTVLKNKLMNVPNDSSDAQGEAVMLAIYKSLKDNFASLQSAGLFRANTNTAMIAITDEQDVCWNYPNMPQYPIATMVPDDAAFQRGDVPVLRPKKGAKGITQPDPYEMNFFAQTCSHYVGGVASADKKSFSGGRLLTPADVVGVLKGVETATGAKVIMNGIVHKTNLGLETVNTTDDENEMAHGTLDVIQMMHGTLDGHIADLKDMKRTGSNVDFTKALELLGNTTRLNMKINGVFDCGTRDAKIHPDAIDTNTVELDIIDQKGNPVAHYSSSCSGATPCQGGDGGVIANIVRANAHIYMQVSPADQPSFVNLINSKRVDEISYRIHFSTKQDFDISTGQPLTAAAGRK